MTDHDPGSLPVSIETLTVEDCALLGGFLGALRVMLVEGGAEQGSVGIAEIDRLRSLIRAESVQAMHAAGFGQEEDDALLAAIVARASIFDRPNS